MRIILFWVNMEVKKILAVIGSCKLKDIKSCFRAAEFEDPGKKASGMVSPLVKYSCCCSTFCVCIISRRLIETAPLYCDRWLSWLNFLGWSWLNCFQKLHIFPVRKRQTFWDMSKILTSFASNQFYWCRACGTAAKLCQTTTLGKFKTK